MSTPAGAPGPTDGGELELDDRIVFAIPLKSRAMSSDWDAVQLNLHRTIASIANSDDDRWKILLCGHDEPDGLDPRVTWLPAKNQPPSDPAGGPGDKIAKRRRMGAWVRRRTTHRARVMFSDADDLIHRGLVRYLMSAPADANHTFDSGYYLDAVTQRLHLVKERFWFYCGTSFAGSFVPDELPRHRRDLENRYATPHNHLRQAAFARESGLPVHPVPFPAAVYLGNHAESLDLARKGARESVGAPVSRRKAARILTDDFGSPDLAASLARR